MGSYVSNVGWAILGGNSYACTVMDMNRFCQKAILETEGNMIGEKARNSRALSVGSHQARRDGVIKGSSA